MIDKLREASRHQFELIIQAIALAHFGERSHRTRGIFADKIF